MECKKVENILHYLLWEIQLKLVNKWKDVSKCLYTFNFKKQYNHEVLILEICEVLGMGGKKEHKNPRAWLLIKCQITHRDDYFMAAAENSKEQRFVSL